MIVREIQYREVLERPRTLRKLADALHTAMQRLNCRTLVVRGSSGLAPAAALCAMHPEYSMVYVRKAGERSHGEQVENGRAFSPTVYADYKIPGAVILDDLVASGGTVREMLERLEEEQRGCRQYIHCILLYAASVGSRYHGQESNGLPVFEVEEVLKTEEGSTWTTYLPR